MTTRHAGYTITLTHDIREDDAEATIAALRMVRNVASVKPIESDVEFVMAQVRVRSEVRRDLFVAIDKALPL